MAHPLDRTQVTEARPAPGTDRSLGELFSELTHETTTLIRQEIDLAKTELAHKAASAGKDMGLVAAGGAVAYAGFLALVAALIIALGQLGLPWWISALLVGLVVLAVGGFLVMTGLQALKRESFAPTETLQSLKEDAAWARDQTP
jgi:hypothetical protein